MLLIAHRGNLVGPIPEQENSPSYIDAAINRGFLVEIDVRSRHDGSIWLGHDYPQYKVDEGWIISRNANLIVHCKNLGATEFCYRNRDAVHYFCHANDPYVVTSRGLMWAYPGFVGNLYTIMVMPEATGLNFELVKSMGVYGVCSDFVNNFL
jgi:hypothetical protein